MRATADCTAPLANLLTLSNSGAAGCTSLRRSMVDRISTLGFLTWRRVAVTRAGGARHRRRLHKPLCGEDRDRRISVEDRPHKHTTRSERAAFRHILERRYAQLLAETGGPKPLRC